MRLPLIALVLAILPNGFLCAQGNLSNPLYIAPPASEGCPVSLSTDRVAVPQINSVDKDSSPGALQLRIHFKAATGQPLLKADIIVHGMKTSGTEGLILTGHLGVSRRSSESYQLTGTPAKPLADPLLATKDMIAISWLEVARLEYADGKVWQASEHSRCTAAPSLLVLVDSGH